MQSYISQFRSQILQGIPEDLPKPKKRKASISHAPKRNLKGVLTPEEKKLAIENALRYFPIKWHEELAIEFSIELKRYGRIYMHRFMPEYAMKAHPIDAYPAKSKEAAAIMLMIQNNLDIKVAKHPHELITYGGNGAVFQNWAQYLITMQYLAQMSNKQTLVIYSGHPMGLFPSRRNAPRVVVTNGMMIPNYSTKNDWNKYNALGVTQYGQMTAGSYMYIGPQGIVHGTTITLLNAARLKGFGRDLSGKLFVTSGLGGMSGAQSLAANISGLICVIAETDIDAIKQRILDGYILADNVYKDLSQLTKKVKESVEIKLPISIVFHGNIVHLLEYFVKQKITPELLSDQTSLHNIDDMGYTPCGMSFDEAKRLNFSNKEEFLNEVKKTLIRHVKAINTLSFRGAYFWDYGNAFLKEAGKATAAIFDKKTKNGFKYPSYVEDIMGPLCFDYGFGPFRWVCTSGLQSDLDLSDKIAAKIIQKLITKSPENIQAQLQDNLTWIQQAKEKIPVVGSKSRILYADAEGRIEIAKAFNKAIKKEKLYGPIVLGRDHHDVSGTDSPYRETSNIYDGSSFTADMSIQNVIGDSFRGATWVSIHNGGGVGWGEAINGGFGMVLDGSKRSEKNLKSMLHWDVFNGICRRSWARNPNAISTIKRALHNYQNMTITEPSLVDTNILKAIKW